MKNSKQKKIRIGVTALTVAIVCFCACSFALSKTSLSSRLGVFGSGDDGNVASSKVSVDINNNEKIIEDDLLINPGETISRSFYITNEDSEAICYGFSEVEGNLKDFLNVKLISGSKILYDGKASELESFNADKSFTIRSGEKKEFKLLLSYPTSVGNNGTNSKFQFRVTCDYLTDKGAD